jgi:hypothetical protein
MSGLENFSQLSNFRSRATSAKPEKELCNSWCCGNFLKYKEDFLYVKGYCSLNIRKKFLSYEMISTGHFSQYEVPR